MEQRKIVVIGALVTVMSRHARPQDKRTLAVQGSITSTDDLRAVLGDADGIVMSVEADWTPAGMKRIYVDGMRNVMVHRGSGRPHPLHG